MSHPDHALLVLETCFCVSYLLSLLNGSVVGWYWPFVRLSLLKHRRGERRSKTRRHKRICNSNQSNCDQFTREKKFIKVTVVPINILTHF